MPRFSMPTCGYEKSPVSNDTGGTLDGNETRINSIPHFPGKCKR